MKRYTFDGFEFGQVSIDSVRPLWSLYLFRPNVDRRPMRRHISFTENVDAYFKRKRAANRSHVLEGYGESWMFLAMLGKVTGELADAWVTPSGVITGGGPPPLWMRRVSEDELRLALPDASGAIFEYDREVGVDPMR